MLTVEEYIEKIFELVRLQAQIEEVKRYKVAFSNQTFFEERETQLHHDIEKILKSLEKETAPMELAPVTQYIEIELQPISLR